jgi:catechol 2,3-dioxygenase-like lactoylglutathione lyase family enzyme
MPNVTGILETALSVEDVEKSAAFYRRLFGFGTLLESERLIALEVAGRDVLLLFKKGATSEPFATPGGVIPGHGTSGVHHFAFSIRSEDYADWKGRLEAEGIAESEVSWPGGAKSLYFRDPDQNAVELITPGFWRFNGREGVS